MNGKRATVTMAGALAALLVPQPAGAQSASQPHGDSPIRPDDLVCGPRAVHTVLAEYGRQVELIDLVREIQWPDLEAGSSLADLEQALQTRGIHTFATRLPEDCTLRWPHPVVLCHAAPDGGALGHFSVWLPTSTAAHWHVSNGLRGIEVWPRERYRRDLTGVVLLTSPEPIDEASGAFERIRPPASLAWWFALAVVPVAWWWTRRRGHRVVEERAGVG